MLTNEYLCVTIFAVSVKFVNEYGSNRNCEEMDL